MENKYQIGEAIKNKRLELNLRMDDLANNIGITRSTLSSIENGGGNYSIDTLLKILQFLDMSLDIDSNTNQKINRQRASRTNTINDKKINRFIVMCVEQYGYSINQDSKTTYQTLDEAGIINELKDDYEDMHGMSTAYINDYIHHRLGKQTNIIAAPLNRHVDAKMILISQTIELIAKKYKLTIIEARKRFYESRVVKLLDDDETGLYGESALYLLSLYDEQK